MVTQLQPDVRAYLHGGEVIKRYIRVEEVAQDFLIRQHRYRQQLMQSVHRVQKMQQQAMQCSS